MQEPGRTENSVNKVLLFPPLAWGWSEAMLSKFQHWQLIFLINYLKRMTTNFLKCVNLWAVTHYSCLLPAMQSWHMTPLLELSRQHLKPPFFKEALLTWSQSDSCSQPCFFPTKQSYHNFTYHETLQWLSQLLVWQ